jgi:hypothetical protein
MTRMTRIRAGTTFRREERYSGNYLSDYSGASMTADQFRRLALSLPGVIEGAHMGHPDFRVGGKIFASLGYPNQSVGVVNLTPDQQSQFVRTEPKIFQPVKGGWGRKGSTMVFLKAATKGKLSSAMVAAWRNRAPEDLAEEFGN